MFELFKKKEEQDVKELFAQGAVIVDVRSREEFESGHVKGAINIPLDTLPANASKAGNKDAKIITCCMSGGRSQMAQSILEKAGYAHVYNGGGWRSLQSKLQ